MAIPEDHTALREGGVKPAMQGADTNLDSVPMYSLEEVSSHTAIDDRWIAINGLVYDVTRWQKKHPGGAKILGNFAGQDATDAWTAMHIDKTKVIKYMAPLLIGKINPPASPDKRLRADLLTDDFRSLQVSCEKLGLYKPNPLFFILHILHIVLLESLAYYVLAYLGTTWTYYLLAAVLLTTAQAQSGWTQHDYGHLSVFTSSRINHWVHYFIIGHLKGASSHWWNFRHYQHHTKPNVVGKDPDVGVPYLFLLGEKMPIVWGQRKKGFAPYNWQQIYFWLVGPPMLLPIYFHFENVYFVLKRRAWIDLAWMISFFFRFFYCYGPLLGGFGAFGLYMFVRFLESHWFTLVTQMNHITMDVDRDRPQLDWVTAQSLATCNVNPSIFNNWFTGHLNFQIEHHLFPTMPRHNYEKVAPLVRSLCQRHDVPYVVKSLPTAIIDIYRSLLKSGQLWFDAYYN